MSSATALQPGQQTGSALPSTSTVSAQSAGTGSSCQPPLAAGIGLRTVWRAPLQAPLKRHSSPEANTT